MNRRSMFGLLAAAPALAAATIAASAKDTRPLWHVFIAGTFGEDDFTKDQEREFKAMTARGYNLLSHSQTSGGWSFIFTPS
jgi:hypothetical protein